MGRTEDESSVGRASRLFLLASAHVGTKGYMRQQVHGTKAISIQIGHADCFVTATCDLNWSEITKALLQVP